MRRSHASPPSHLRLAQALVPALVAAVALTGAAPAASAADGDRPEGSRTAAADGGRPEGSRTTAADGSPTDFSSPLQAPLDPATLADRVAETEAAEAAARAAADQAANPGSVVVPEEHRDQAAPALPDAAALVTEQPPTQADTAATGSVLGVVTGPAGPLADVSVILSPRAGAGLIGAHARTDVHGRYTVAGVQPGDYHVFFLAGSMSGLINEYWENSPTTITATPVTVTAGGTVAGIDAELEAGATITGRVTDDAGRPVAGVGVSADSASSMTYGGWTSTKADGTYSLAGIAGGSYVLNFVAPPTSGVISEYWNDTPERSKATVLEVPPGATVPHIDAELTTGGVITGTVTGPGGAPQQGVQVTAAHADGSGWGQPATTGEDGTYRLAGLAGSVYTVSFGAREGSGLLDEHWPDAPTVHTATEVPVALGRTVERVDAQLAPGGAINGTVTGPGGVPAGTTVTVSGSGTYRQVHTAADGTYTADGLPTGKYTVEFQGDGSLAGEFWDDAPLWVDSSLVPVEIGRTTPASAELAPGGTITGTLTGPTGAPLAGAQVSLSGMNAYDWRFLTTDADGRYSATGLRADSYSIWFTGGTQNGNLVGEYYGDGADWDASAKVAVTSGATAVADAGLAAGATFTGTVTDSQGDPVAHAAVHAMPFDGVGGGGYATTRPDGTYEVDGLRGDDYVVAFYGPAGSYAYEYWQDAGSPDTATPLVVPTAGAVGDVDARLEAAASVSGSVADASGTALSGVAVEVLNERGEYENAGRTEGGAYSLDGLRAGGVKVAFARASGTTPYVPQFYSGATTFEAARTVPLTQGVASTGLDVVMATGATISGRITNAAGVPLRGVDVRAFAPDEESVPTRGGRTRQDGTYVIEGLLPGSYLVAALRMADDAAGSDVFHRTGTTRPGTGTVAVTGTAAATGVDIVVGGPQPVRFADVGPGAPFAVEIDWLRARSISMGSVDPTTGEVRFDPAGAVRREAMAAFLYRAAGSPAFEAPATSPFVDVQAGAPFYREISWLAAQGISKGTDVGGGRFEFRPAESVTREAMAAFLYRAKGRPVFTEPAVSPFADVVAGATFSKEIAWLRAAAISQGTQVGSTLEFRPAEPVRREAMAAFLFRAYEPAK
ncbi:carboxypeptidase regulatory-like domain-containing protein [Cellulomonas aerilata]|uniref:SLH domain-containing protein n=1 Tax=Cellulomonas aerilata TaxID=515326 RepID=A0A512DH53_9CELL|nr:carboxypeptidase regulatory-like domain-containing protein [Cellulomonas aerilata]GEO35809.1 hypothetical protein CAE01nite_35340 [Cellulomonas aerilata]